MRRKRGFTLVEIMIVVAIVALLAAIAIPNLLAAKRSANESAAKSTVRSLSTAAETFMSANNGTYPGTVALLATFIASAANYCGATVNGYTYTCTLAAGGYTISAVPQTAGVTGNLTFTATTGGVLTPL